MAIYLCSNTEILISGYEIETGAEEAAVAAIEATLRALRDDLGEDIDIECDPVSQHWQGGIHVWRRRWRNMYFSVPRNEVTLEVAKALYRASDIMAFILREWESA